MKGKPDLMSILGLVIIIALIFVGCTLATNVETGGMYIDAPNMANFFDVPSVAIVIGGTIAALMLSCPGEQLGKIPKHLGIMFMPKQYDPNLYIEQLVNFARKARINGLLALEEDLESIEDAFLKSSMVMVVDSVDPEKVKQQLEARLDNLGDRHSSDRGIYTKGAAYGPAFGMIGTLIGLINLLKDLEDASKIGPNMAVALITTFYGTVLANVIFTPINAKLTARHEEEYLCCLIICEGVQAIQAGENPKFIQERLMNLLPQYKQKPVEEGGGE